jgi:hypothetical protein
MATSYNQFLIMTNAQWQEALPLVHSENGTMGALVNYLKTRAIIESAYPMPIGTVCVVRCTGFMAGGVAWHSTAGTADGVFYRCQYPENTVFSDSQGEWRIYRNTMQYGDGVSLDKHQYVARLEKINHE